MFRINKTLRSLVDHEFSLIKYKNSQAQRHDFLAQILGKLEAEGDAMRYVGRNGKIAWKATPRLRAGLAEEEAEAEMEAEEANDD
jgi:hypothetical protein